VRVPVLDATLSNNQEVCMGRTGRKRRVDLEDEYWQLILAGIGTVEACRRVGMDGLAISIINASKLVAD